MRSNENNMNRKIAISRAKKLLKRIPQWKLKKDGKTIYRIYKMKNFAAAVDLIGRIALIADGMDHHPGIHLTCYRMLRVTLTTDDIGGLSHKDFSEARAINKLTGDH